MAAQTEQQPVGSTSWDDADADQMKIPATRNSRRLSRVVVRVVLAVIGLVVAVCPEQAIAKTRSKAKKRGREDKRVCVESYYKAKESLQAGRLLDAKEPLGRCARPVCGSFLQQECTKLYLQMDSDVPSVVPVVVDAAGAPGAAFEVRMDGELLTSKLDGIAIPVNPGWHDFAFSAENRVFATQKILIAQGQRNRAISVSQRPPEGKTLAAPASIRTKTADAKAVAVAEPDSGSESESERVARPIRRKASVPEAQPKTGASWGTYALGGVGLAGVGAAGLFSYWGRQDNDVLKTSCAPNCNPSSVHHIRMLYLASDVSGGIGVASLVASTWLFLHARSGEEKASTQVARLRSVDVRPSASGAYATIGGTF
jgi:hypothetical protein